MKRMRKDQCRISAYIYNLFLGSPNLWQKRLRLRIAPAEPGMRVLGVGCGTGSDLQLYAQAVCHVHAVIAAWYGYFLFVVKRERSS